MGPAFGLLRIRAFKSPGANYVLAMLHWVDFPSLWLGQVLGILSMVVGYASGALWIRWRWSRRMARLRRQMDAEIDLSDIPELDQDFFDRARVRKPKE